MRRKSCGPRFIPRPKLLRKWLNWGRRSFRMSSAFGWRRKAWRCTKSPRCLAGSPVARSAMLQFQRIALLKAEYLDAGNPVFSLDAKAKGRLGQLIIARVVCGRNTRSKRSITTFPIGPYACRGDPSWDLRPRILIADSSSTWVSVTTPAEFAANEFTMALETHRPTLLSRGHIPFCCSAIDGLWNDSANRAPVQTRPTSVGRRPGLIEIRVAHYPSYCSKCNRIERRFFPRVGRASQGVLFDTLDRVVRLMRHASTRTGLKTTVNIIRPHLRNQTPSF